MQARWLVHGGMVGRVGPSVATLDGIERVA
jgi:hypothetical protein